MQKILTFYPADIKPTIEHQYKTAILYNPCDGYHLAEWICFNEDGNFKGFYPFQGERFSDDFYTLWAVLPELKSSN